MRELFLSKPKETKICKKCNTERFLYLFFMRNGNFYDTCLFCIDKGTTKNFPFFDTENDVWMKLCILCQQNKPVTEFKFKNGNIRSCKNCENARERVRWHSQPLEEKKAKNRQSNAKRNFKKINARKRQRYAIPEIREKILESQRRRYKPVTKEQREKYKENMKALVRAYQAKKKNAPIVIKFKKSEIIKRDGLICYLCSKSLTEKTAVIEHLIPISRGGNHKAENVKIACAKCNHQKYNKTVTEFKKWRGDYDHLKQAKL